MNPGEVVSWLGWLGWVVGLVSGSIQIHMWRQERRVGPAKERLFEEALRDREGEYTEAQIQELKAIVKALEDSVARDIPRQAKRQYVKTQVEALVNSIENDVDRHRRLAAELRRLGEESKAIPAEVSKVIEEEITPIAMQRRRQLHRIALLGGVAVLVVLFPGVPDYLANLAGWLLGDWPQPYGSRNFINYAAGLTFTCLFLFIILGERTTRFVQRLPVVVAVCVLLLAAWAGCMVAIADRFSNAAGGDRVPATALTAVSTVLLALFIRFVGPLVWRLVRRVAV